MVDMEPAEGMLIQDIDTDIERTYAEDVASIDTTAASGQAEGTRNLLRDQLRSLSQKVTHSG